MKYSIEGGSELLRSIIKRSIETKQGCLIGRFGTIELEVLYGSVKGYRIPEKLRAILELHAGVFPKSEKSVALWVEATKKAFKHADCLATGWYRPIIEMEKDLLRNFSWNKFQIPLRSLEPYYSPKGLRWTEVFDTPTKVCVVTSFAKTASMQVKKGEEVVWPDELGTLWSSNVEWHWVQTGYSAPLALGNGGWSPSIRYWEEAVDQTVKSVLKTDAQVVLIGCGGLGMIIGDRLKEHGKCCIVMGGAIQVLFGIKGNRWANHETISKFWNNEWVWPSKEEIPNGAAMIEGGCYWTV
jgi:hypothetical protein